MNRSILITLFVVACSTPRPAPDNSKVRTGEDTAKTAADAARDAEAKDNTGLLVASSNTEPATTQPTTMPAKEEPAVVGAPILRVTFVKGTLTQSGEPIANFEQVCRDAVAADPNVVLVIDAEEATPHADVMKAVDTAKTAGIQKFTLEVTSDDAASPTVEETPKKEGKTKDEKKQ